MSDKQRLPIRVLVADDESEVREAYRQILSEPDPTSETAVFRGLRERLFSKTAQEKSARNPSPGETAFVPVFCEGAEEAVEAVRDALAAEDPFAVVFLDMRMPPGPDGVWAAARIRELDPAIEIVLCTAYSDVDPRDIGGMVPPEEKLSYLQKPFHPHEIRQMTISLASKWRSEHRIVKLAYFDALTGLPNREQSRNRLNSALSAAKQDKRLLAVLYLDLDNFKRVNDTLGHAVGDELLCLVAARLRGCLRSDGPMDETASSRSNHVARLGGDEFIVILPNIRSAEDASAVAARLICELQEPMRLAMHTLVVTPSVGVALYPDDGVEVDVLLRNADLAMYFAKRKGPGMHTFFDASMNDAALHRFALEGKLRGALERGEFTLHYQPQFDVRTGGVAGMEALLRWTNDELGVVPPAEFIPVAEETGLILGIGEWALRTACVQAKRWADEGLPLIRMAVNVSGQQFVLKDFPQLVAAIIEETGIEASMLELEITESVVMKDEAWAELALAQLKQQGVMLAIDDFGTGYSSFGRLRHFAVDRLKIDRSFMTSLIDCSDDQAIAAAIISMSRSLRINVTAEGVESFPQLLFLQEHECNEAQGFLFSRALPAADAHKLLSRAAESTAGSRTQRLRSLIG
ncbi:MAG TPA: EAL domain-containing protein [Steroidobacteraceae bacterium]|nr:EAL domain-containing protein [Steroidobacteraceae bacterium]